MQVKQAISAARKVIEDTFAEEAIRNLGLEEVEFDDDAKTWRITLGFSRPWNEPLGPLAAMATDTPRRTYKVVTLSDETGKMLSITRRRP